MEGNKGFFFARGGIFTGGREERDDFEFRRDLSRSLVQTVREIRRFCNIEPLFMREKVEITLLRISSAFIFSYLSFRIFLISIKGNRVVDFT